MKKIIIIMGIFSLLGCNKYRKIYLGDENFSDIESKTKISSNKAAEIYDETFHRNFTVKEDPRHKESFYRVTYMYKNFYYIGFASKNDKRDMKTAPLYFLAKIDSDTGEITIVQ